MDRRYAISWDRLSTQVAGARFARAAVWVSPAPPLLQQVPQHHLISVQKEKRQRQAVSVEEKRADWKIQEEAERGLQDAALQQLGSGDETSCSAQLESRIERAWPER